MEWISVDERLPEKNDYYLVTAISGTGRKIVRCSEYDHAWGWISHIDEGFDITNWTSLPEPAKGGTALGQ